MEDLYEGYLAKWEIVRKIVEIGDRRTDGLFQLGISEFTKLERSLDMHGPVCHSQGWMGKEWKVEILEGREKLESG